jgi:hypothetical protein
MDIATIFDWFAQTSLILAADQRTDPDQRDTFLKLAALWAAAAQDAQGRRNTPLAQLS